MRGPLVLAAAGAALALFGLLWTTCALVSGFRFPVAGYSDWNLIAGIALVVVGIVVTARGWAIRTRESLRLDDAAARNVRSTRIADLSASGRQRYAKLLDRLTK